MALYIPHSILHLARLLYVRPGTFEPYYGVRFPTNFPSIWSCMLILRYIYNTVQQLRQ